MKKRNKQIAIIVAIVVCVTILAGCDVVFPPPVVSEPPPETPELPAQEEVEQIADATDFMEPFSRYDETVIVTVGRFHSAYGDHLLTPGIGLGSNAYIDMLYNELNIQIEIIFNVPFEEYNETLLRHKAADTLPDTFWIPNTAEGLRFFNELVQDNRLADLTDAFTYTVGGMSRELLDGWDFEQLFQYNLIDGRILGTPVIGELFNTPLMWIRQDWLDELELDMPRTIGELEAVALAFTEAQMGGRNTAGIMFKPDGMFSHQYGLLPIFAAFGAYPNNWIDVGGYAEWGGIQPETRDVLALLREWNEMGIIPNRLLNMSGDEVFENIITTQSGGIFFGPQSQPWANWHEHGDASQNLNENIVWMPFLGPLNAQGQYAPMNELIFPGGQVVLASHRNPEAVIKAMNLINEVRDWRNPDFDSLWLEYFAPFENMDTAGHGNPLSPLIMPKERFEIAATMREYNATGVLEVPAFLEHNLDSHVSSGIFTKEDITPQWWSADDETRRIFLDEAGLDLQAWWVRFYGYWAYNVVGNMFIDGAIDGSYVEVMPAFVGETNAWAEYGEQLIGLQTTTFLRIISGEFPIEAFDDFVAGWLELGGEAATHEVNELTSNS